ANCVFCAVVADPLITPVALFSVMPLGSEPPSMRHVTAAVPQLTHARVCEYGSPTKAVNTATFGVIVGPDGPVGPVACPNRAGTESSTAGAAIRRIMLSRMVTS